jgi:type II secretory pathway pseudopilin PulG
MRLSSVSYRPFLTDDQDQENNVRFRLRMTRLRPNLRPPNRVRPPASVTCPRAERGRGFTYIGLLIFMALMGIALAGFGMVWHTQVRREKERELLFVGDEFRRAIGQYYELSPGGDKRFPLSLDDLLLDRRYPAIQRYLRRVYVDPIAGKAEWGLVKGPDGRIMGVHSLSEQKPLKQALFPDRYQDFEDKAGYHEWQFVYSTPALPVQPQLPNSQPPAGRSPPVAGTPPKS